MKTHTHKLAIAVLALSLTHTANAADNSTHNDSDNKSTYWGLGIGSVLGAAIAGPPGAAIGATLGGSIGWGKDQNDALDESLNTLEQKTLALQTKTQALQHSKQEVMTLKHSNATQATRLNDLESSNNKQAHDAEFLKRLVGHYSHDIYFQIGQSSAPDYTEARLASLVELLNAYPDLQVTLKGYTDTSGSITLNSKLAQARVDGIKTLLSKQGIDPARITGHAIGLTEDATPPEPLDLISSDTLSPDMPEDDLQLAQQAHDPVQPKNPALDRRVSIELSVHAQQGDQTMASLAVLEP